MNRLKTLSVSYPTAWCWALLMLVFVFFIGLDAYISDDPENTPFMVGPTSWRGPYELLIILGLLLAFGFRYSAKGLWIWFSLACVCAITLVMDSLWMALASAIELEELLDGYTMKPQDGVILLGIVAIFGLIIRLYRNGYDFLVAGHLFLLMVSTAFLAFVHVVVIYGAGQPLAERDLDAMRLKATNEFFAENCRKPGTGCYEGPWVVDADYPIQLASDLSKFTYSQFVETAENKKVGVSRPDNTSRLGGFHDINQFSKDKLVLLHAWNTGWNDVSIIDQPEKYAVFYKNGDRVRVMIDYETAVYTRLQINVVMRPLMLAFSFVWIISGLCILLGHAEMPRFKIRRIPIQSEF